MTILAFDTSLAACSAAILPNGAGKSIQRIERMDRGHAEALFPMIEACLQAAGCGFGDLTALAVTIGPGSFTGVRAGVAAARGLALAAKLPIVAATSLEVMAQGLVRQMHLPERANGFLVAHDARRGEFYVQRFTAQGQPLSAPELCSLSELAAVPQGVDLVVGSGAADIAAEAERCGRALRAAFADLLPEARDLADIASTKAPESRPVTPLYLRAPDAKPQMGKSIVRAG